MRDLIAKPASTLAGAMCASSDERGLGGGKLDVTGAFAGEE